MSLQVVVSVSELACTGLSVRPYALSVDTSIYPSGLLIHPTISVKETLILLSLACDIYTWGDGSHGILGHGEDEEERLPRVVESLLGRHIQMTACGRYHTMALSGTMPSLETVHLYCNFVCCIVG